MAVFRRRLSPHRPSPGSSVAAQEVAIPSAVRILRTERELRDALERAEETERRIGERTLRRSGRYAGLIDELDGQDCANLRAVDGSKGGDRRTG